MRQSVRISAIALLLIMIAGCSSLAVLQYYAKTEHKSYTVSNPPRQWPLADTQFKAEKFSLNSSSLQSLIVAHRGQIQLEWYASGFDQHSVFNIKSVSKSVLSAVLGIAIGEYSLSLDDEVDLTDNCSVEQTRERPTAGELLGMSAGFDFTENQSNQVYATDDWRCTIQHLPLRAPHGQHFNYGTIQSYLLGAWLSQSISMPLDDYLQQRLFNPAQIHLHAWRISPEGIPFAGSEMEMTARDLLAFGQLYLNSGRFNGDQVIPASWVKKSRQVIWQNAEADKDYGYGWWLLEIANHRFLMAQGYGGQMLLLQPKMQLAIVSTASSGGFVSAREHEERVYTVIQIAEQVVADLVVSNDQ